ncbi:uncharacterized protein LOC113361228 isoform X1 [Papaver somniferum]|uniref:uncharacterized protein LOC113361228 isoform X1 n=1 Tax=Papaver somniferum TaxID=3469 RepID=UPI000E6FB6B5|nr:uncharacterized protein LOC113361228 isoform X1 [Papaver somniferum]
MVGEEEQKIVCNDGDILNAKWDACIDLSLRRVFYTSVAGAVSSLVLFRGPASRWAALAFGAGVGIGSAYTESSRILEGMNKTEIRCQKGCENLLQLQNLITPLL